MQLNGCGMAARVSFQSNHSRALAAMNLMDEMLAGVIAVFSPFIVSFAPAATLLLAIETISLLSVSIYYNSTL